MSNLNLPRQPAYDGINPEPAAFVQLGQDEWTTKILAGVGSGDLYGRAKDVRKRGAYYLHRTERGCFFLKILPSSAVETQLIADSVARWVSKKGVRASLLMPNYPRAIDENFFVFSYEYLQGRFARPNVTDIDAVSRTLALMHLALRELPDAHRIKDASSNRVMVLKARLGAIVEGRELWGPKPNSLLDICSANRGVFDLLESRWGCQPLHGDLVVGNIMFPESGGAPVILDFEDTAISFFPIDLDIALVVERFILMRSATDEQAYTLCRTFLSTYSSLINKKRFLIFSVGDCLRLLALRALLTLSEKEASGGQVNDSEWHKFYELFDRLGENQLLLSRIDEEFRIV